MEELVEKAKNDNSDAFTSLILNIEKDLYCIARSKIDNENDNDNDNNINIFILSLEKEIKKKISDDEKSNIKLWFETFDGEVIKAAFNIAKRNNKMSIGYIDGILNNWKTQGKTKSSDFKTDIINTVNNQTENISKAELTEDQKQLMNYDWLGDTDG